MEFRNYDSWKLQTPEDANPNWEENPYDTEAFERIASECEWAAEYSDHNWSLDPATSRYWCLECGIPQDKT